MLSHHRAVYIGDLPSQRISSGVTGAQGERRLGLLIVVEDVARLRLLRRNSTGAFSSVAPNTWTPLIDVGTGFTPAISLHLQAAALAQDSKSR